MDVYLYYSFVALDFLINNLIMNKEYTVLEDNKVIISDEKRNKTQLEYYDNLDKVLIEENVIEEIENIINKLTQKNNNKNIILSSKTILKEVGIPVIVTPFVLWTIYRVNPFLCNIDTIFGPINAALLSSFIIGLPLGIMNTQNDYHFVNRIKTNEEKGSLKELEYLKIQLEKEKEKLVSLQKDKTYNNKLEKNKVYSVEDKNELKYLWSKISDYYDLGYNEGRYKKYYNKGKLEQNLSERFTHEEIETIKNNFEDNIPKLTKKLK